MKLFLILFLTLCFTSACSSNVFYAEETDSSIIEPDLEELYIQKLTENNIDFKQRFAQTKWFECDELITGNFSGFSCSNKRAISVILSGFIQDHFFRCVNYSLKKIKKPQASEVHIVHLGILGDANHSPKSLHSEARAIDIDAVEIRDKKNKVSVFNFKNDTNDEFYTHLRTCWGETVSEYNGCPILFEKEELTASIGKENPRHQNHLHISVPYCIQGQYSDLYFKR